MIRKDSHGSLRVVPVTEDDDLNVVHLKLCDWIDRVLRDFPKVMLMRWASPPCTGGSPVINLIPEPRGSEIREQRMAEFALLIKSSRGIIDALSRSMPRTCKAMHVLEGIPGSDVLP